MCVFPLCSRAEEARDIASQMIGHQLHTKQTGTVGRPCQRVHTYIQQYAHEYNYILRIRTYIHFSLLTLVPMVCITVVCVCVCVCVQVLVSEKLELVNEYYFALVMERSFMVGDPSH